MDGVGQETWVFPGAEAMAAARHLPPLRRAIRLRERLVIQYVDGSGIASERSIHPLQLEFWGRVWTLATWCETRQGFRSFRVDRIEGLQLTSETFPDTPGTTLADWRRLHGS
jgi:predicted DNA-binding transcriptional regulator YafY